MNGREQPVPTGEIVSADELAKMPLFSGIPYKFLQFNGSAVVRRRLPPGEVLCREGDYGRTAFVILSGRLEVFIASGRGATHSESAGGSGAGWAPFAPPAARRVVRLG